MNPLLASAAISVAFFLILTSALFADDTKAVHGDARHPSWSR